ncbi:flagellar hook assembly protein FlgD [Aquipuribacter sp. MA13-6]|uniref:flagellar hook assembly protein FlgD n=1 Tax=unclassified Aquipuribacter TaxID=2635084 RepID=UPI003EE9729F
MTVPTTGTTGSTVPTWSLADTTAQTAPATTAGSDSLGKDAFLKLLVAQLRYQDPLNPAEGAEFIAQTAQFTQVEKLQEVADSTAAALGIQQRWGAGSTVGREVTFLGAGNVPVTGTVTSALFTADQPVLRVMTPSGPVEVPFGLVQELRDPVATTAPVAPAPATTPAAAAPPAATAPTGTAPATA